MPEIHIDRHLGGRAGRNLLINSPGVSAGASSRRAFASRNWLCGASLTVLAMAATSPARAADYPVSDEAGFRAAIDQIILTSDTNATITFQDNVVIADPTAFPALTNPVTINTGPFALSGADTPAGISGTSLTFLGGQLILNGALNGGTIASTTSSDTGGTGRRRGGACALERASSARES
jgi:hypothetical protein